MASTAPVDPPTAATGDLIAFCGWYWESRVIALRTCRWRDLLRGRWWSHVGLIADRYLFESTVSAESPCALLGEPVCGVQAHDLADRVAEYHGKAYRLPLRRPLTPRHAARLSDWCRDMVGTPYDRLGAVLAGTTILKRFEGEGAGGLFCSEFAALGLRLVDIFPTSAVTISKNWTPAGLIGWAIESGNYGPPQRLGSGKGGDRCLGD